VELGADAIPNDKGARGAGFMKKLPRMSGGAGVYAAFLILGESSTAAATLRRLASVRRPGRGRRPFDTWFAVEGAAGTEEERGFGADAAATVSVVAGPAGHGNVKQVEDWVRLLRINQVRMHRFGVLRAGRTGPDGEAQRGGQEGAFPQRLRHGESPAGIGGVTNGACYRNVGVAN
jgi:hypothetical protein